MTSTVNPASCDVHVQCLLPSSYATVVQICNTHYSDVIMGMMPSQITSLIIVYSTVYLGTDQRKHQSSASLAFVWGIHRGPVNSPHKWPVTRKMFPFDDVIMSSPRYVTTAEENSRGKFSIAAIYRSYKHFNECDVTTDIATAPFHFAYIFDEVDDTVCFHKSIIKDIIDSHAQVQTKMIR